MTEDKALDKIVNTLIAERKRDYRNKIIFRVIVLILFLFLLFLAPIPSKINYSIPHIAVIEIDGVISSDANVSAQEIIPLLQKAKTNDQCKVIFLKINSGGGSATQSKIIFDEIVKIKDNSNKKIYSIIEDVGASGGYYIAMAADEIVASETSIVGSIGVRLDSYDVRSFFNKLGIKSRTIYSGDNKLILDPFYELTSDQYEHVKKVTNQIHQQFITDLKDSRKNKLMSDNNEIFSGLFYTGIEAKELGLVDRISNMYSLKKESYDDISFQKYNDKDNIIEQIMKSSFDYLYGLSFK